MGICISQYRVSIGLFNRVRFKHCTIHYFSLAAYVALQAFIISLSFLLILCGDVEINPGPVKTKSLNICHVNIRSLNISHLRAIKVSLCDTYDIITISETMLSAVTNIDLRIPGYHPIIRRDRNNQGGGIAMYIRESIGFTRLFHIESNMIEIMFVKISTTCGNLLLSTVYRPP